MGPGSVAMPRKSLTGEEKGVRGEPRTPGFNYFQLWFRRSVLDAGGFDALVVVVLHLIEYRLGVGGAVDELLQR